MDRWTINQLNTINDFDFAIAILNERRSKISPYSPLGLKISHVISVLCTERDRRRAEHYIDMADIIYKLEKHHCRYMKLGSNLVALYDNKYSNDRVHIEIGDDGKSVSYAGKIIGGLDELEKRL